MISYVDVRDGNVSITDILRMCEYLDMKADCERYAIEKHNKPVRRGRGVK